MDTRPPLTVAHVRVRPLDLPLARPVETASGVMATAPLVLIDLNTREGVVGRSYVRCYTPMALRSLAQLIDEVGELLVGADVTPFAVEQKLQRHFRLLGPQGLTGIAMSGIDMALWDALARALDVPLVTLLGGRPERIPAYASLRSMNPERAAAEAEEAIQCGFTGLKVKIGAADLEADLATVRAVRRAVPEQTKLMVDYNQSLSVDEAIRRAWALDDEDIFWIEEPTRADDFDGQARIADAARTDMQSGENWWGPHDVAKALAALASDHVMLDVVKVGGVTGWMRAAALVEPSGTRVSSHAFPEFSVHLLGVTPTALWLEYLDHVGPILKEPVHVSGGYADIPDRPGAGIEWDESAISRVLRG